MQRYINRGRIVMVLSAAALLATTTPAAAGIGFGGFGAFFGAFHSRAPQADIQMHPVAKAQPVTVQPLPPAANQRDASRDSAPSPTMVDYTPAGGSMISDDLGKLGAKAGP